MDKFNEADFWILATRKLIDVCHPDIEIFKGFRYSLKQVDAAFLILRWLNQNHRGLPMKQAIQHKEIKIPVLETTGEIPEGARQYPPNFQFHDDHSSSRDDYGCQDMHALRTWQKSTYDNIRRRQLNSFGERINLRGPIYSREEALQQKVIPPPSVSIPGIVVLHMILDIQCQLLKELENVQLSSSEYLSSCQEFSKYGIEMDPREPTMDILETVFEPHQLIDIIEVWTGRKTLVGNFCGSGKTIIIVGLLVLIQKDNESRLANNQAAKAVLVAMPSIVLGQFCQTLRQWAPSLGFRVYDSSTACKQYLQRTDFQKGGQHDPYDKEKEHIIVTSFSFFSRHHPNDTKWQYNEETHGSEWIDVEISEATDLTKCFYYCLCDELHKIKRGLKGAAGASIIRLKAKKRWGLTATPFPNKLQDLYGELQFLQDPDISDAVVRAKPWEHLSVDEKYRAESFMEHVVNYLGTDPITDKAALQWFQKLDTATDRLQEILQHIMIRRTRYCKIPEAVNIHTGWIRRGNNEGVIGQGMPNIAKLLIGVQYTEGQLREFEYVSSKRKNYSVVEISRNESVSKTTRYSKNDLSCPII